MRAMKNFNEALVRRGQPDNKGKFRENPNTNPEGTLPSTEYGISEVQFTSLRVGDTVLRSSDPTDSYGVVSRVEVHDVDMTRVILASSGTLRGSGLDRVHVNRTEEALNFSNMGNEFSYWDRVAALCHPNMTPENLAYAVKHEEEDDFYVAIAQHQNSTADTLDEAAKHNAYLVSETVIKNPNTATGTLETLRDRLRDRESDALERRVKEGRNPNSSYLEWEAKEAGRIASLADTALNDRGTAE